MGSIVPKQFLLLRGKPVIWYPVKAFLDAFSDVEVIVVLPESFVAQGRILLNDLGNAHRIRFTTGGSTRFESVRNGLKLVTVPSVVFVHDGARCLLKPALIQTCYEATLQNGNAVPAIPAQDSVRLETATGNQSLDRNKVQMVQTPQTFLAEQLIPAFEQNYVPAFTDEASVAENAGITIHLVRGDSNNIKITRPMDLVLAEQLL